MSVMGVLLLITLLLALFLITPSKANLANQDDIRELESALAKGIREADELHRISVSLRVALARCATDRTQISLRVNWPKSGESLQRKATNSTR